MKEKIDANEVISLYINGNIATEIAIIVEYHVETVRNVIRDYKDEIGDANCKKIKEIHSEARQNKFGDIISFNKKLIRNHMSTKSVVENNQNAYKMNKRKTGLIYNNIVGSKPCDLPKIFR